MPTTKRSPIAEGIALQKPRNACPDRSVVGIMDTWAADNRCRAADRTRLGVAQILPSSRPRRRSVRDHVVEKQDVSRDGMEFVAGQRPCVAAGHGAMNVVHHGRLTGPERADRLLRGCRFERAPAAGEMGPAAVDLGELAMAGRALGVTHQGNRSRTGRCRSCGFPRSRVRCDSGPPNRRVTGVDEVSIQVGTRHETWQGPVW